MLHNKEINGYANEYEFCKHLNKKKVGELDIMFQDFIFSLFEKVNYRDIIYSWKNPKREKGDIFVRIRQDVKRISIKKGFKNSVHVESIGQFKYFLLTHGVKRNIVNKYLAYHYADGTLNGTGKNRQSVEEYKSEHQKEIDEVNEAINQNVTLIHAAIKRFILGSNEIDAIVCGVVNDFIWMSKKEIIDTILKKRLDYSSGIHFSCLSCQPQNRCLNYNPTYEVTRHFVQVKWYNIQDHIIEVMNDRLKDKVK